MDNVQSRSDIWLAEAVLYTNLGDVLPNTKQTCKFAHPYSATTLQRIG
jgi:hypothetical protein